LVIACAVAHDVRTFVEHELRLREEVSYPPFSHIALVRFDGLDEAEVRRCASDVGRLVEAGAEEVEVLGPAPAPLARLSNRFRYRFLVRAAERKDLRKALLFAARAKVSHRVRVSIDVDPMSLL
jgi:primosomal protein N' (replication factor Y) (superfamily II helicase)